MGNCIKLTILLQTMYIQTLQIFQREGSLYIACNDRHAFFSSDVVRNYYLRSCQKECEALTFLLDNIYIRFVVYKVGKKGAWRYSVAATVPPPHRKYLFPGTHPTASKTAVVWGTGRKVVYGYSSIQRGDSGTNYVRAHLTPHRSPQQCFLLPSIQRGKKEPGVHAATVPPPHRKYFCPGTKHFCLGYRQRGSLWIR